MYISFSGFEGCGKSTLLDDIKKNKKYTISKESARFLIDMKKTFLDDRNDLSYTALLTDLKVMDFAFDNGIKNFAADRNFVDGLVYLKLYNGQNIDHENLNNHIEDFCKEHNRKTLFDTVVLLKHPKDNDHILNNILNDEDRIYGQDVEQYKKASKVWEEAFLEICKDFPKLAKNIKVVQAYPENPNILNDIKKIMRPKNPKYVV